MNSNQSDQAMSSNRIRTLTICLILITAVGNSIGVAIFINGNFGPNNWSWIAACDFSIGVLSSQPCLLATWLAWSPQNLSRRIFHTAGVLLFLTVAYIVTLASFDRIPIEPILVIFGISIGLYLIATIPVSLFRWSSGHALSRSGSDIETDQSVQFGIRHIFVLMTVVAILVPVCQWLFRDSSWESGAPWLEVSVFICLYGLIVCGAFLLTCASVFATRRVGYWVSLVLYVAITPVVAAILMALYFATFQPLNIGNCINGVLFASGFSLAMVAVLSAYYFIGYRLRPVGVAGNS